MRKLKFFFITFLMFSVKLLSQQNPNALAFDGENDYVVLGKSNLLKPVSALTIQFRVFLNNWNVNKTMSIISSSLTKGYEIKYQSGNIIASLFFNNSFKSLSTNVSTLSGWHQIACTFDGQIFKLYIDGIEKTNSGKSKSTFSVLYESEANITIGSNSLGNSQYFNGYVDELQIWNVSLTELQIKNSTAEVRPQSSNFVAYYRFNQGIAGSTNISFNSLQDLTSNALNGTLQNFALSGVTSNWIAGFPLKPADQSGSVSFSNGSATSVKISWSRPGANKGGNGVIVFMSKKGSGTASPDDDVVYSANSYLSRGAQIKSSGWYCVYKGTGTNVNVTGLTSGSSYRVHIIEYQNVGSLIRYNTNEGLNNPSNYNNYFPAKQASNLAFSNTGYYGSTLSWIRGDGSGVIVFASESSSGNAAPADYLSYAANGTFKNGSQIGTSGWYCVYNGTGSSANVGGLLPGRTYRFMVCEFNGSAGTEKYNTTTATFNVQNLITKDFIAPTVQANKLTITGFTNSALSLLWNRGNGSKMILFAKQDEIGLPPLPNNTSFIASTNFGSGSQIGSSGWYCVYNDTGRSTTINGLTAGRTYRIVAFEYNGSALAEKYLTEVGTNVINAIPDYKAPSIAASNIKVISKTFTTIEIDWTKGNGGNAVVFVGKSGDLKYPVNDATYTANESFGSGSQIDISGVYCVYSGNLNHTAISNLVPNTSYDIAVYEFNGENGLEKYCSVTANGNPISVKTLSQNTFWNGISWSNGTPTEQLNAIIEGNYSSTSGITCKNLTVNSGIVLNIQPGSFLTVNGTFTNNGTIKLLSANNSMPAGSLITSGQIINNGSMIAERYISPGTTLSTNQHWHLMSVPNAGQTVETVFYMDYMLKYIEKTNTWESLRAGVIVKAGEGFLVKTTKTGGKKASFTGTFNNGDISLTLNNTGPDAYHGYNLVGNPYPSAIDWNSTGILKQNIGNTIWVWDPVNQRYMTWNGVVGQNGGTQFIPSMQAFFIKVNDNSLSATLGFTNSSRVHSSALYQKNKLVEPEILRLETSGNNLSDELVIYADQGENDVFKLISENALIPQLYVSDGGADFAIYKLNGRSDKKLNLTLDCGKDGYYSISAKEINFSSFKNILLVDHASNDTVNLLKVRKYDFSYSLENDKNRFELLLSNDLNTSIKAKPEEDIKVWGSKGKISFIAAHKDSEVKIYSLEGKEISSIIPNDNAQFDFNVQSGVYFVEFKFDTKKMIKKVLVY